MFIDVLRKDLWLSAALLLTLLTGCLFVSRADFSDRSLPASDGEVYMFLARSLRETGEYRSTWIEGQPAHVKYPPGFPVLLAPFFVDNEFKTPAARAMMVALSSLAVLLSFLLFRPAGSFMAIAVAALAGQNMLIDHYGRCILSEIPFLVLTLLVLLAWEDYEKAGGRGVGRALGLACVLVCVFLMRTVGVILILAVFVRWAQLSFRQGFRIFGQPAILFIPVFLVMFWWFMRQAGQGASAQPPYIYSLTHDVEGVKSLTALMSTWVRGVYAEVFYLIPRALSNVTFSGRSAAAFLLTVVFAGGLWGELLTERRVMALYTALYLLGAAAWPWTHTEEPGARFMAPLVPLLLYYFLRGCQGVWLGARGLVRPLAAGLMAVAAGVYLGHGPLAGGF